MDKHLSAPRFKDILPFSATISIDSNTRTLLNTSKWFDMWRALSNKSTFRDKSQLDNFFRPIYSIRVSGKRVTTLGSNHSHHFLNKREVCRQAAAFIRRNRCWHGNDIPDHPPTCVLVFKRPEPRGPTISLLLTRLSLSRGIGQTWIQHAGGVCAHSPI